MNTRFSSLAALVVTFASFALGGCAADGEPMSDEGEAVAEQTSKHANDVATSERANPLAPSPRVNDTATSERANPTGTAVARGDAYKESTAAQMVERATKKINVGPLPPKGITWGYYSCDATGKVIQSATYTSDARGWLYTADHRSPNGTCCVQSNLHLGCIDTL